MTLGQIMRLALRQLDEDPADISEYDDLFRLYANQGYRIALLDYLKPREWEGAHVGKNGFARVRLPGAVRPVEARLDESGLPLRCEATADGEALYFPEAAARDKDVHVLFERVYPPMREDTDEPRLPESAHAALADYICWRHLMNGNLAKQSRAGAYRDSFYQQMRLIRPDGQGSVTRLRRFYEATGLN